jgi:hypothetical protein
LSTTGNGVLAIFHTKQVESGSEFFEKLAHLYSFIKFGTPPHFSFHKPWLTESYGCPPTFTYVTPPNLKKFEVPVMYSITIPESLL